MHLPSGIDEILMDRKLIVRTVQLGNAVADINVVQRSSHALDHARDGGALFSGLTGTNIAES